MTYKLTAGIVAALALLVVLGLGLVSLFSRRPDNLGIHDGRLAGCPDTPNCVSSQANDEAHRVAPLRFSDPADEARRRLVEILKGSPRVRIIKETETYLHAEFTSAIFRFVDDVEFLIKADSGEIEVRSASRTGRSDLGTNRRRVEVLREKFEG